MWMLRELRWSVTPGLGARSPSTGEAVVSVGHLLWETPRDQWSSGCHVACEPLQDFHPEPGLSVVVCFEACFQRRILLAPRLAVFV